MVRSSSNLLFALVLCLSFALLIWWTSFLLLTSGDIAAAGERLSANDNTGAAVALGAADPESLAALARRRQWMFASEGVFFAIVLLFCGRLYLGRVRREADLQRHRDRFLAAATHELKTPLATISLLLESLRDNRVPEGKRSRYLTNGLLEAERLERGLHNVLVAGGLQSAGRATATKPGNLAEDVREATEALRARALAAEVELELDAPDDLVASRDAAAWQLVVRNLLDNAIKFSPPGSTVRVSLKKLADEAVLGVEDRGRGLSDTELAHAFEPFYRGDDRATGGTGLGLHLVHELVDAHGGSVSADSAGRDCGSAFTVRLPLKEHA
ncbi:MAG: sensor histidine kinase [Planctomycetota bacterium]